ncbi:hypothetical protein F383_15706 [Gossypium arboreum]|uniref:Uncharacterized protein n=1 Tax=Gossypium arboreum TaxID=29729 RepID=A0A0B0NCC2_GOSAR|nr:hypothetical protein F383_15706 [Gossypium arboreum]
MWHAGSGHNFWAGFGVLQKRCRFVKAIKANFSALESFEIRERRESSGLWPPSASRWSRAHAPPLGPPYTVARVFAKNPVVAKARQWSTGGVDLGVT